MTTFDEIYDMALTSLRDYKLDKLYQISEPSFKDYLKGFLKKAIPKFTNCTTDLESNVDFDNNTFTFELSLKEQDIISNLMTLEWLKKEINDVTQFNMKMNDTDKKMSLYIVIYNRKFAKLLGTP